MANLTNKVSKRKPRLVSLPLHHRKGAGGLAPVQLLTEEQFARGVKGTRFKPKDARPARKAKMKKASDKVGRKGMK